jgi:hypothetical protein
VAGRPLAVVPAVTPTWAAAAGIVEAVGLAPEVPIEVSLTTLPQADTDRVKPTTPATRTNLTDGA